MNGAAADSTPGHPDTLLSPDEYHMLVGPPLQTAASVAASRGDPDLFHDMASMLALWAMVDTLAACYRAEARGAEARTRTLESAAFSACALVFTRSGLKAGHVKACLGALEEAYRTLLQAGVLGPQEVYVKRAFKAMSVGQAGTAHQLLLQAAQAITNAVDQWQSDRANTPSPEL